MCVLPSAVFADGLVVSGGNEVEQPVELCFRKRLRKSCRIEA
jgi:hypothetical protein